jgi:uncharacterized protein (DUF302 family)
MYEFNIELKMGVDEALAALQQALQSEKLGVVSEIDVQAIMKKKLDLEMEPYRILGGCNPLLASRVLEAEPNAGTLLPCNIVVRSSGNNRVVISFMDPVAVLGLSDSETINAVAQEARQILERVAERLKG